MNIVKLQEQLKSVPDQALVGYVQNPGQVPSYLALSELQRRKAMRAQYQAQAAGGQAEQPSVAEQITAPEQPEQGIASLPVENVGSEEAYAQGGIVAFGDGGITSKYDQGTFFGYGVPYEYVQKLYPGLTGPQLEKKRAELNAAIEASSTEASRYRDTNYPITKPAPVETSKSEAKVPSAKFDSGLLPTLELPSIAPTPTATKTPPTPAAPPAGKVPPAREGSSSASARASVSQTTKSGAGQGITAGYGDIVPPVYGEFKPELIPEKPWRDRMGEKPTMEGIAGLMEAERARRGISEDPYAEYMDEAKKDKDAARKDYESNLWMRLAEFGTTWASTPGDTLAAAGEAGKKVVPNLIADKREMRRTERELSKEVREMAIARENMREARMKGDTERYDKELQRYQEAEAKVIEVGERNINTTNAAALNVINKKFEADTEAFKAKEKRRETDIKEAGDTQRARITASAYGASEAMKRSELEDNVAALKKDPNWARKPEWEIRAKAKEMMYPSQMAGVDQRAEATRETAYNNWAKANTVQILKLQRQGVDPRAYWEQNVYKGGVGSPAQASGAVDFSSLPK